MANANVFSQFLGPIKSIADYQDEDAARQAMRDRNALSAMALRQQGDAMRQTAEDRNALRRLASQYGGDPMAFERALSTSGSPALMTQAQAMAKQRLDAEKASADAAKTTAEAQAKKIETARKVFEYAIQGLQTAGSPQAAAAYIQQGVQQGAWGMQDAQRMISEIPPDPQGFSQWRISQLRSITAAKDQLPTIQTRNTGGTTDTLAIDPFSGGVQVTNSVRNTQSPESIAGNNTARRGQDMADKRARDANETQRALVLEDRELKVGKLRDESDQRARAKSASIDAAANQIAVIDKALTHPGRETATGLSGSVDPRNYVPGTDATDFRTVLDQIGGAAFLQAFESLKGGGAITEVEGKRATDAIARLNRAQSDAEFQKSLKELRSVMTTGYKRLAGADYVAPIQSGTDLGNGFTVK